MSRTKLGRVGVNDITPMLGRKGRVTESESDCSITMAYQKYRQELTFSFPCRMKWEVFSSNLRRSLLKTKENELCVHGRLGEFNNL